MAKDIKTPVQFRKLQGEIIAVFPYDIQGKETVTSYAHIGQHSTCTWEINHFTKQATPDEYKGLLAEIKGLGYDVEVIKRRSHKKFLKAYHDYFLNI